MKLYTRQDFLKLPSGTVYSKISNSKLMEGLFCMTENLADDWLEQDLIAECGFPNGIKDGIEAIEYQFELRDSFQEFKTDLNCSGRDGAFDNDDKFIVWDKEDKLKLIHYLQIN